MKISELEKKYPGRIHVYNEDFHKGFKDDKPAPGVWFGIPPKVYHENIPGLSPSSGLTNMYHHSWRGVKHLMGIKKESKALDKGSSFDTIVMYGRKAFEERYGCLPAGCNLAKTEGKKAKAAIVSQGKVALKYEDYTAVETAYGYVSTDKDCVEAMKDCFIQVAVILRYETEVVDSEGEIHPYHIDVRCQMDFLPFNMSRIRDLKSTGGFDVLQGNFEARYWTAQGIYKAFLEAALGEKIVKGCDLIVADVSKEFDTEVMEIDPLLIRFVSEDTEHNIWRKLDQWAQCEFTGVYPNRESRGKIKCRPFASPIHKLSYSQGEKEMARRDKIMARNERDRQR